MTLFCLFALVTLLGALYVKDMLDCQHTAEERAREPSQLTQPTPPPKVFCHSPEMQASTDGRPPHPPAGDKNEFIDCVHLVELWVFCCCWLLAYFLSALCDCYKTSKGVFYPPKGPLGIFCIKIGNTRATFCGPLLRPRGFWWRLSNILFFYLIHLDVVILVSFAAVAAVTTAALRGVRRNFGPLIYRSYR